MSDSLIPITFPLTPRMHAFIEVRDTLRCLSHATQHNAPYAWLAAAKEMHQLMVGKSNRKPIVPSILSLVSSMRKYFLQLAKQHPEFQDKIMQACLRLECSDEVIRQQAPKIKDFLSNDALLTAYTQAARQQDLIGHALALPQIIQVLWHGCEHANNLHRLLKPLEEAVEHLNQILHSHVPWEQRIATSGYDVIKFPEHHDMDLIIIGVSQTTIEQGITPQCAAFRTSLRLRFSVWKPGEVTQSVADNQNYSLMMVPIL